MPILAPSVLAADFSRLGEEVRLIAGEGVRYVHLDVMDGTFVPSISFGAPVIKKLRHLTDLVFDVHMMVEEPCRFVGDFVKAGADMITIHAEACRHLDRSLRQVREHGVKVGVALNPATSLSVLDHVLGEVDMVLLMSVNPGFGGQAYIPYVTDKIRTLRKRLDECGLSADIEVDGGVGLGNAREIIEAGANVLVAGSSVFGERTAENIRAFFKLFQECGGM